MYISGNDDQLGIVDAIMAVATLKSLFGFGKKKAALKQIEANAAGKFTSQLPPYADWAEFLTRPASNPKAKAAGAKTYADEYAFWRGRKDSILVKNQIATPEDYVAYLVITYGLKDGWINPNAKPGDALYKNGPVAIGTQIPIFDYNAIVKWAEAENAKLQPSQTPVTPTQLTPATVKTPAPVQMPTVNSTPQATGFFPATGPLNYSPTGFMPMTDQTTAPTPQPQGISTASMVPLALLGLGAVFLMTRKKGRR